MLPRLLPPCIVRTRMDTLTRTQTNTLSTLSHTQTSALSHEYTSTLAHEYARARSVREDLRVQHEQQDVERDKNRSHWRQARVYVGNF